MAKAATAKAVQRAERGAKSARAREAKSKAKTQAMVSVMVGPLLLGLVERAKWDIPSIKGVPDSLTYGLGAMLAGHLIGGKAGSAIEYSGAGLIAVTVRDVAAGKTELWKSKGIGSVDADEFDDFDDDDDVGELLAAA